MSNLGNRQTMAQNIQHYMNINNKTRGEICGALGIKYTTLCDWINAKTYPRIDKIEAMANYFGIEKSDLVEKRSPNETPDLDIRRIERARQNMPQSEKEKMMRILKASFEEYFSDEFVYDDLDE